MLSSHSSRHVGWLVALVSSSLMLATSSFFDETPSDFLVLSPRWPMRLHATRGLLAHFSPCLSEWMPKCSNTVCARRRKKERKSYTRRKDDNGCNGRETFLCNGSYGGVTPAGLRHSLAQTLSTALTLAKSKTFRKPYFVLA